MRRFTALIVIVRVEIRSVLIVTNGQKSTKPEKRKGNTNRRDVNGTTNVETAGSCWTVQRDRERNIDVTNGFVTAVTNT